MKARGRGLLGDRALVQDAERGYPLGRSRKQGGAEKHREAACPGCGATIAFTRPGTLTLVCEFCQSAVRRTDFDVELLGKMSERVQLASWFQVGTTGRHGDADFEVRGQLQLDHGRGLWNEWAAELDDGSWIWIAEAQGSIYVMSEVEAEGEIPGPDAVEPGSPMGLPGGKWMVSELGAGEVVTAAGELPVEVKVGERTRYADVCRGLHGFGTVDWTRAEDGPPEVLLGVQVEVEALELDPSTQPEHRPDRVPSQRVACPECGAGLDVHDPEITRRVVCTGCRTVLSHDLGRVKAVQEEARVQRKPAIELGAEGALDGSDFRVLGMLSRRVEFEGDVWHWDEYLLRERGKGYAFLLENQGHWALLRPLSPAATGRSKSVREYRGLTYKHFTTGDPEVVFVLGEFFWDVAVGDTVRADDFVCPPRVLSVEATETEISASEGGHVEAEDVFAAFGKRRNVARKGVGMVQPNPHAPLRGFWKLAGKTIGLLVLFFFGFAILADNELMLREAYGPVPAGESEEAVVISEPFEIAEGGDNVKISLEVPGLKNGWVGVAGTLVETESQEVRTFVVDAGFWSGVEGGEAWTEGSRKDSTILGSVPAGTYQMRFASLGSEAGVGLEYKIEVRRDVVRFIWFFVALWALLLWPVWISIRCWSFEKRRWDESDHPMVETSS